MAYSIETRTAVRPGRLPRSAPALAAALLATSLSLPRTALAAACCTSATSYGIGRLLIWEDFACGLQLGHSRILGQYDLKSVLHRSPAGYSEGITLAQPWAILRLSERVQWQAWVPVIVNDRTSDGTRQVAGGTGDVGTALRLELVSIGEYQGLPSLAVIAGAFAPTGRRVEETSPPLFAGTTGRGAWGGTVALELEYAFLPYFVRFAGGVSAYVPFDREDTGQRQQYAPILQASFSAGRELVADRLVAALGLMGEWEGRVRIADRKIPDSSAHVYTATASLSWMAAKRWTVIGTGLSTLWPDGGGMNRDARVGFILGVRYGHY